ncbi:MAG: hypothetical protein ACI4QS_02275 [Comamonas sp.]
MRQFLVLGSVAVLAVLGMTGCSTAAMGAGALGAVAEAVAVNSQGKELRRRAQEQSDISAYEDAQTPVHVESEGAYIALIERMQKQGMWFASLAHIDALENRWKPSEDSSILRADALRHAGNLQASTALYEQLLKGRQASRALHGLGLNAAAEQRYAQAVLHLQTAQKLNPTDPALLSDLGFALLHVPGALGAGLPLKQAAQLEPQNPRIQSNLAVYLVLHGESSEASRWMAAHQMTAQQREQVFATAQRIAALQVQPQDRAKVSAVAPLPVPPVLCSQCLIFESRLWSKAPAL